MTVIRTDQWLEDLHDQPIKVIGKLKPYFKKEVDSEDIYDYLCHHGMYRKKLTTHFVEDLRQFRWWDIISNEERRLKQYWKGPTIPIFIFPSDATNRKIMKEYNGKSGLAFNDKLFLFLSPQNEEKEIKSLFIHEYNHVCRLANIKSNEEEVTLLDSIILEGMAENAVREQVGEDYVAPYVNYYSEHELMKMWEKIIKPNLSIMRNEKKHFQLLYGQGFYPKMAGYCVGYFLIKKYLDKKRVTSNDILDMSSETIVKEL